MIINFSSLRLLLVWLAIMGFAVTTHAQSTPSITPLSPTPRQAFTPTPASIRGYWNIDVVGDFTLPPSKSITWSGAGRNLHVNQDWSKLFRRGFSSIEKGRMTPDEVNTDNTKPPGWRSRLSFDQRALILYQNYLLDPPFNLPWAKNSELARTTYFERPPGSPNPRQSLGAAMSELSGGCVTFGDCPSTGRVATYSKIYYDIENDGTSPANFQEHANLYAYKAWKLRQVISPNTMIGGIMPVPHNSHGYSRSSDFAVTGPDWLWWFPAAQIAETNTRGRGMPDALVGRSFGELVHFQMPGTYFLSSDLDYNAPHNGDEDRHWLASLLGEQEVNRKLSNKPRIAWQWLFNTQSGDPGQLGRAEIPAPPAIAEGMAIFYWFTGAYGTIFWDDWNELTPNAPVVPGRENLDNNRNYSCYEHYIHGLWRLFKHHGDLFNGNEKYLNEDTECSYDGGVSWYRLNANKQKRSGRPFARAIVNGDQILIAATNPYARSGQQTSMMVRYVQDGYRFYTTINLNGDEISLGRARMPQGNSPITPAQTTIESIAAAPLMATVLSYNCATGAIALGKTGGSSGTPEYLAVGITNWSSNPNQAIEPGLRADPKPVTIRVRQGGIEGTPYVFDFSGYCRGTVQLPNPSVPPTPTPPPTSPPPPVIPNPTPTPPAPTQPESPAPSPPVTPANTPPILLAPIASQTVVLGRPYTLNLTGVFSDQETPTNLTLFVNTLPLGINMQNGIISGTPSVTGTTTVMLVAVDPGGIGTTTSFAITVLPGPPDNTAPLITGPIPPQSTTVGVPFYLDIRGVFADTETPNQLTYRTSGLPAGLQLSGGVITGITSASGINVVALQAVDPGGLITTTGFQLVIHPGQPTGGGPANPAGCGSPANSLGRPLEVLGVADVNCQQGTFRIVTTGGDGSAINYANNTGLSNADPANCVRTLASSNLIQAVNNPLATVTPFQIRITQNAMSTLPFLFNLKEFCTGAARVAVETKGELEVTILGNPTTAASVMIEISGFNNEPLTIRVMSAVGQVLHQQDIESANGLVRHRLDLASSPGLNLVQVSTPTRIKTVKLIRQ